jgi:hypothetical protein
MNDERHARIERTERREFRQILAAIVYHAAPIDTEASDRNPFLCRFCGHAVSLCTCQKERAVQ